jgi:hypothetical protein
MMHQWYGDLCIRSFKMAFASHLGPWLLGTVKNTTGTTAGTVRNMGATIVAQQVAMVAGSAVTLMLPAGACITAVQAYMTTGAAGTPDVTVGGTIIGTLSTAAGLNSLSVTAANVGTMLNVGSTDAILSFTATALSAGTLTVAYIVRGSDGAINPASA